jgi:hypothetical protein
VEHNGQNIQVEQLKEKGATVGLFGMMLRVVHSPMSRRVPEPWFILTNDMASSQSKIVQVYYHRFEIEETFKDAKRLLELQRLSFVRQISLKVVLWVVFLRIALLYAKTRPTK